MVQKKQLTRQSSVNRGEKKPVILQLLPELKSGGVERGTVEIVKACVQNGYNVLVVSEGGAMVRQVLAAGGEHIAMPVASKNPLTMVRNAKRLAALIKERQVKVVHARSRAPAWSGFWACQKTGCRFMTTFHGVYSFQGKLKRAYNVVMTKGECVIAASQFIYDHVVTHYDVQKERLHLIPRGVDMDYFDRKTIREGRMRYMFETLNLQKGKPVILLPGRLTEWKGHEYLLDALAYLSKDSFQCVLLGDDKHHAGYRTRLQKKIQALELDDVVHIVQNVSDMPAVYSLVDIVVSASLRPEAFGRVAIEAQAMECLVVATNHGGSCETVIPEKTGWLVETDDADAFAGMLKQALDLDKDKRNKMVQAARENVQNNFSLTQMTDKTLDVYSDVLTLRNDIA